MFLKMTGAKDIVLHYYQFNIEKYRKDTVHLSPLEHGIYRLLLDTLYLTEVPLPLDKNKIMRSHCIRTKEEKRAFFAVLEEFFSETEKGFINCRVENELKGIYEKSEKARAAAMVRWEKHNAKSMRTHSERNADGMLPHYLNTSLPNNNNNMSGKPDETVVEIFDYWCKAMKKNAPTKLTAKRKSCIKARLREGYSVDQIKQAIDGCARSSYHMGQNNNGTVYNDLTLICRSGEKVEHFANNIAKIKPGDSNGKKPYRESLAERSARQTAEIFADIAAREANNGPVGANDSTVRPHVGEPGRPPEDGERGVLDGIFTVEQENGKFE